MCTFEQRNHEAGDLHHYKRKKLRKRTRKRNAHLLIGTDEAGDAHNATISEQLGHLRDTPDVLFTVLGGEAQVLVQACAHVVAIQRVGRDALADQILFQSKRDGGLTSAGETSQPDGAAAESTALAQGLAALVTGHVVRLVHHVGGSVQSLQHTSVGNVLDFRDVTEEPSW